MPPGHPLGWRCSYLHGGLDPRCHGGARRQRPSTKRKPSSRCHRRASCAFSSKQPDLRGKLFAQQAQCGGDCSHPLRQDLLWDGTLTWTARTFCSVAACLTHVDVSVRPSEPSDSPSVASRFICVSAALVVLIVRERDSVWKYFVFVYCVWKCTFGSEIKRKRVTRL